ncbi:uncharacterized protein LOC101462272 [Ceratitis capitata]|uniref:(Mediterranean fruit fly) hypothetical protein n=1 Tax=Ceratitis capitata TaxID=7213 RepID=W8BPV3_CERCA|nr:uncharacterized protein LOC101462272 [Ceratitis capitata]CAD7004925.1 unnamed protein product [Ceratitis capitata]
MEFRNEENDQIVKLKNSVHEKFVELRAALEMREKLLLRQLEVVASTKQHLSECGAESNLTKSTSSEDDIKILFEDEVELLRTIRSFGRFQLGSIVLALKHEDYITPNCDHEIMYKNIQSDDKQINQLPQQKQTSDFVVVDLSKDKCLFENNAKHINDSIVNITLEEAKELIRKTRLKNNTKVPPLNLEELDDEMESSIVEAVSNLSRESYNNKYNPGTNKSYNERKESSAKRTMLGCSKSNVTINNCNGTINLRNISSVTINCGNDNCEHLGDIKKYSMSSGLKVSNATGTTYAGDYKSESSTPTPSSVNSCSNHSSNSSSRSHSKKVQKGNFSSESHSKPDKESKGTSCFETEPNTGCDNINAESKNITCDFYNRLINEIKRNLDEKSSLDIGSLKKSVPSNASNLEVEHLKPNLVFKNFENLNIVLKNDRQEEALRSVHIEHWLSEIIKDTDLEPMQNTEILEHSKLKD